ncbi:MAG TPA: cag pathogenicity island protein Cag26 [Chloroflexi bacterium]|nr:cag pathogenicity island protein Cag26 [Chloroflexota bacterium]
MEKSERMRTKSPLRRFWQYLKHEKFDRLLLFILLLLVVSSIAVSFLEPGISLINGFWWSIVTLTTVGYGDISPATIGGRVIAVILMLFGIGLLGTLSATIASFLIDLKLKENRGMSSFDFENHIILCEWNHQARTVLQELRADPHTAEAPIVLIADIEMKPVDDDDLHFIQGNVTDETLERGNLDRAKTVVILGDTSLDDTSRDAKAVLTTLTVESINPDAYTIVELENEANVKHCQRANANEIIVASELSSNLMARAALNHGISKVISEVLSVKSGNELYKIPLPASMAQRPFIEIFTEMKQTHRSTVIAAQKGNEGEVISNPPVNHRLEQGDYLIVMALDKPQMG